MPQAARNRGIVEWKKGKTGSKKRNAKIVCNSQKMKKIRAPVNRWEPFGKELFCKFIHGCYRGICCVAGNLQFLQCGIVVGNNDLLILLQVDLQRNRIRYGIEKQR